MLTLKLDDAAIASLVGPGGPVDQAVARAAGRVRDRAKQIITQEGRVDTGALRQSIVSQRVSTSGGRIRYEVGSELEYAIYQHEGVKGPIYPKHAKVLRFKPKGASGFVFRPQVSGFTGIKFLTRALDELQASDFAA